MLVGIEHYDAIVSHSLSQHGSPLQVTLFILRSDLQLECSKTLSDCFVQHLLDLVVVVSHPAYRCIVAGITGVENGFPCSAIVTVPVQYCESVCAAQHVFDVT